MMNFDFLFVLVFHQNYYTSINHPKVTVLSLAVAVVMVSAEGCFSYSNNSEISRILYTHQGGSTCLAFSPGGKILATGGVDGKIKVWDMIHGKELHILSGHKAQVMSIAFSKDSKLLASAGWDGSAKLWDVVSGKMAKGLVDYEKPELKKEIDPVLAIAFSPVANILATGDFGNNLQMFDVATGMKLATHKYNNPICSLEFSLDGKYLVLRQDDGVVAIRDIALGKDISQFGEHILRDYNRIRLVLAPDGNMVGINGLVREKIQIWNMNTGKKVVSLKADFSWKDSPIKSFAFTPDGKMIVATTLVGGRILFWDTDTGKYLGFFRFPFGTAALAISSDGNFLASAHWTGAVYLWKTNSIFPKTHGSPGKPG
jgi:WD40 repeat protein